MKQFKKRKTRRVNNHSVTLTGKQREMLVEIWLTSPYQVGDLPHQKMQTVRALQRRGLIAIDGGSACTTKEGGIFAALDNLMG